MSVNGSFVYVFVAPVCNFDEISAKKSQKAEETTVNNTRKICLNLSITADGRADRMIPVKWVVAGNKCSYMLL